MTGDRWHLIEEIFHGALEKTPSERDAYVAHAQAERGCAGESDAPSHRMCRAGFDSALDICRTQLRHFRHRALMRLTLSPEVSIPYRELKTAKLLAGAVLMSSADENVQDFDIRYG